MPIRILDDFVAIEVFADEVERDTHTVRRWMREPNGLPYARIGNKVLIHIPTAKEWIFSRMRPGGSERVT